MSTWRKRQVSKETNLRIPKLKAFSSKILPLCLLLDDEGFLGRAALLGSSAYFDFGTEQGGGELNITLYDTDQVSRWKPRYFR